MAEFLTTKIAPLASQESTKAIKDAFLKEFSKSDEVVLLAGYVSSASLIELDHLVDNSPNLRRIVLLLGMYRNNGIPETVFHTARRLNKKWKASGIGEIRYPTPAVSDHEKTYLFSNYSSTGTSSPSNVRSAMIGSNNLSFLHPSGTQLRQYETAVLIGREYGDSTDLLDEHRDLFLKYSDPFDDVPVQICREDNEALKNIDTVIQHAKAEADLYRKDLTNTRWLIQLKVPADAWKMQKTDAAGHSTYTASNINVCYSAPRGNKNTRRSKPRDWYEMQLHVGPEIRRAPGYP